MERLVLPPLREELALLPGAALQDGQPGWMLHDPVRNLFFQLDWLSFEILSRWALRDPAAVLADLRETTTLSPTEADIEAMLTFLQAHQLLRPAPGSARQMAERLRLRKGGFWQWALHNYLFFRIPLLRPDRWLSRYQGWTDWIFTRTFLVLTLLAALVGLINVSRLWESYSLSFVDLVSPSGLFAYGLTVVLVKLMHELGHAFTAKRYGCRVPTMGVAFLVMWPVAYTDTNEVWKLVERRKRLAVVAAGIATELTIAVWATLAWAWLPEGQVRTAAFLLSSTTWISSVLINASPFMRFDGYFLMSDAMRQPNLHERSFALARWDLRERLFALGEVVPEHFPEGRKRFLILFAWLTWIYRLTLFLGIAAIVYHFFIKLVGVLLFMVEIVWFVLRPFVAEFQAWRARGAALRRSRRAMLSAGLALLLMLSLFLPWPSHIRSSAMLLPQEQWAVYAPENARISALPLSNGSRVRAGTLLIAMESPALQAKTLQGEARQESLALQSGAAGIGDSTRKNWQVLNEQLQTARAELSAIASEEARYQPRAPYDGIFVDQPPDLRAGEWVANRELLGRVIRTGRNQVVAYVSDEEVHRLGKGSKGIFIRDGGGSALRLSVLGIDQDASRALTEPELAAPFGGDIAVREKNGVFYPEHAIYRVLLAVEDDPTTSPGWRDEHSWRGRVTLEGEWEAPGLRLLRSMLGVFWRESGF